MTKPICIYHANCQDGFMAATIVRMALGREAVVMHPGVYGEPPPDVTGREVYIVDFSYPKEVLLEMAERAESIVVLDHHKSAAKDLEDFSVVKCWKGKFVHANMKAAFEDCAIVGLPPILALFDMERCGSMLAWEYFFGEYTAPKVLKHIQDRDLWRFELTNTRATCATLSSYPYDFDMWKSFFTANPRELLRDGDAIERKHWKDIREFLEIATVTMYIAGYAVKSANVPYMWASDAGHLLCKGEPFAATWYEGKDSLVFSLRSDDDGMDVAAVAALYGGGGHEHAAGFRVENWSKL